MISLHLRGKNYCNSEVLQSSIHRMRTTEDPVERKSGKYFYYDSPLYEETGFWIPVSVPPMLESDHDEWSKRFGSNGGYFPEEEFSWGQLSGEDKEMTIWDVVFEMLLMARGKLGAGTSLPGLVAAKVGAKVTLTDNSNLAEVLDNMKRICELNKLNCEIIGFTWGEWDEPVFNLHPQIMLGADVLYDSSVVLHQCL